jgi:hypothetical protein
MDLHELLEKIILVCSTLIKDKQEISGDVNCSSAWIFQLMILVPINN